MNLFNRLTLKNFFKNGAHPTESHFSDLIDSTVNKLDDGFAKSIEDGLQLSPLGDSNKLMSFYEDIRDKQPDWQFVINPDEDVKGMSITDSAQKNRLFLKKEGGIGVDTIMPKSNFDVNGTVCSNSRVGGFAIGAVPADGEWQPIVEKLSSCHAFEVVARASAGKGRGRYAMAHAIALNAFNDRSRKIKVTQAWYGSRFWNRIMFRWSGNSDDYRLEIRTRSSYGSDGDKAYDIKYHVTSLWDNKMFE